MIFNQYDAEGKGFINAKNIADMSDYLGIKITPD